MKYNQYEITVSVWLYPGRAGWHFATIPQEVSEDITKMFADRKRGWGSLPVIVTVGATPWKTSIFPENKTKTYLLPLKASMRKKEGI